MPLAGELDSILTLIRRILMPNPDREWKEAKIISGNFFSHSVIIILLNLLVGRDR